MKSETEQIREIPKIDTVSDTREILAHAREQARKRNYQDYVIVDVDSHHTESATWKEVVECIEDPVIRSEAKDYHDRVASPAYGLNDPIAFQQEVGGRIAHQTGWEEPVEGTDVSRDVVKVRRAMESMGIDYMIVFPTRMLHLGMHPQTRLEALLARAYNRWLVDRVLKEDERIKSMLYLPFSEPDAALRIIEEFTGEPGVIGFMVTSVRNRPVHHNQYIPIYAALEERGMPLAFHGGYSWYEPSVMQLDRFISMHSMAFVLWNLMHMINLVVNGIPERFPTLKFLWIESGLAWVPFLMQRLDNEYMMRTSEAPLLQRRPSEYIRDMFFSSQPLERTNLKALELTCEMIQAETQLLYASDWPHWDFDLPSTIFDLPFLSEQAKRNILGESALKLFNLERPKGKVIPNDDRT